MRFQYFVLIMTLKGIMCTHDQAASCGLDWSPSFLYNSRLTDGVRVKASHPWMPAGLDLVDGLTYTVSLTGEAVRSARVTFLVATGQSDTGDNTSVSSCSRRRRHDNSLASTTNRPEDDVVEVVCHRPQGGASDGRLGQLPVSYLWTSPENVSCPCLSVTSVIVLSDSVIRSHPFTLCKPTVCRQYHTESHGHLLYNSSHLVHRECGVFSYVIMGGNTSVIELQYLNLEVNADGTCENLVSISLGEVSQATFCGDLNTEELQQHYYTTRSGLARVDVTINSRRIQNFLALVFHVHSFEHGLQQSQVSGYISRPHLHNHYPPTIESTSRIVLPDHFRIQVYLTSRDSGSVAEACTNDTVAFRDLVTNSSTLLTCRKTANVSSHEEVFQSDSSKVEIEFQLNPTLETKGFQLFYKAVAVCHNITSIQSSTFVTSHNYPFNYLNNEECFYQVSLDADTTPTLTIHFLFFHTESNLADSAFRNNLCKADFLEIHSQGRTERICGNWVRKEHLLSMYGLRSPVWLRFVTNKYGTRPGFVAKWETGTTADQDCYRGSHERNLSRFLVMYSPQTWRDSQEDCLSWGGSLATLDDLDTHLFIEEQLNSSHCDNKDAFWIGANDISRESEYQWTDGSTTSLPRWFPGWPLFDHYSRQPSDDGLSDEDCVEIRRRFHLPWQGAQLAGGYFWNDRSCQGKNPFICRIDIEDTTSSQANTSAACNLTLSLTQLRPTIEVTSADASFCQTSCFACYVAITRPDDAGDTYIQFHVTIVMNVSDSSFCDNNILVLDTTTDYTNRSTSRQMSCLDWSNNTKSLRHTVAAAARSNITFRVDHFHTLAWSSMGATILNSNTAQEIPGNILQVERDSTVDIYSTNYPDYPSTDVIYSIIFRAPIGHNIHINNIAIEDINSWFFVGNLKCEDVSTGLDAAQSIASLNFGENFTDRNDTMTNPASDILNGRNLSPYINLADDDVDNAVENTSHAGRQTEVRGMSAMSVTSVLNRLRVTVTSNRSAGFKVHLSGRAVEDVQYLNKTTRLTRGHFDSCSGTSCLNRGLCHVLGDSSAFCECLPQYTGMFCQVTWCEVNPCVRGRCGTSTSGYFCSCPEGYWGRNCEMDNSSCADNTCSGNGHCVAGNTSHPVCLCTEEWSGPMCTQRLEDGGRETLGQRLLKEPIWIGLIVILSVIMLFGVVYILRRRCGALFGCCQVATTKDDNILNANGTITLNSFPLKRLTRPPSISIVGVPSPVLSRSSRLKSGESTPTSSANIWNSAFRFFASYKDTERSLISAPLTTDFSKATDTSLSQVNGDNASVGAVVGGKLQLNLHIRENQEEREAMSRASSMEHIWDTPMLAMKRSYTDDALKKGQRLQVGTCSSSHSLREDSSAISSALEHIYPYVIVQSPDLKTWLVRDGSCENEGSGRELCQPGYIDSTGAHVIQVDLDDYSNDSDSFQTSVNSDTESDGPVVPLWKLHSRSADYIHQLEQSYNDTVNRNTDKYRHDIDSFVRAARGKVSKQCSESQIDIENELVSSSALRKRERYGQGVNSRSMTSVVPRDTHGDYWRNASRTDHGVFRSGHCHSREASRVNSRCADITGNGACPYKAPVSCGYLMHGRLADVYNRSDSLTRTISSTSRSAPPFRNKKSKTNCNYKLDRRKELKYLRSVSTNCEHSTSISDRRQHRRCCHHYRRHNRSSRIKHSSSCLSLSSTRGKLSSSTDSDFMATTTSTASLRHTQDGHSLEEANLNVSVSDRDDLPPTQDQLIQAQNADVKDIFQKVFSQEVDLDDFSLPEEDGEELVLPKTSHFKENVLVFEPASTRYLEEDINMETNDESRSTLNCSVIDATDDVEYPQSPHLRLRTHRNSVVTMLAGSCEGISVSKHASFDVHQGPEAMASCASRTTPTTCNVIMYKDTVSQDSQGTPLTSRSHLRLSRKHSSLDLVEPLKRLQANQQSLRPTSSMQELSNQATSEYHTEGQISPTKKLATSENKQQYPCLKTLHDTSGSILSPSPSRKSNNNDNNRLRQVSPATKDMNNTISISSSLETLTPQTLREQGPEYAYTGLPSTQYLSITDSDSAMSSTPSPQVTHGTRERSGSSRPPAHSCDVMVQDSAYQTKQSSLETEGTTETRVRRPMTPLREEDRHVTQRLQQAAVKLMVIQQRFRRARHNLSTDSAVHTISEDDPALDDVTVASGQGRTVKPGVMYSGKQQTEPGINEFSAMHCAKIIEEQDMVFEFEV